MDRGAWRATVHGVAKSQTQLNDSAGKESACNARDTRDLGLILELGKSPGGGNGNPLQYSCLENPMGRGAWWATVYGAAQSQT